MREFLAALRQFRKNPGFAVTVILTIALGIGANTAIFTLVHAVLLRSLPVTSPKMLYRVGDNASNAGINGGLSSDGDLTLFSYELYRYLRDTTPAFEQLAGIQSGPEQMSVRAGDQPAKAEATEYVSGNYFRTLGVGSFTGRVLDPKDDTKASAPVGVMSYAAWQADYGSDPGVVGKTFTFQGHPLTVVGIAPAGFYGDRISTTPPAFWLPLATEPLLEGKQTILYTPNSGWLYVLGRLKPGVRLGPLTAQITASIHNWLLTQPTYTANGGSALISRQHVVIVPGGGGIQQMQEQSGKGLYLLMAISALVLLVACANVANLLLARGSAHRADTSLRMALGAARSRIVRQMLTESVLLACLGGLAGLAIAYAGTKMILSLAFPNAPQLPIHASPSLTILGFAFLLSLATGVVFGVFPAWITSHADPAEALRGANRSTRERGSLPQRMLIVFQAALSLILLVAASLLTRSLANLQNQNLGIQTDNRYVVSIDPQGAGYSIGELQPLYQELEQRFGGMSGMAHVGLALWSPLSGTDWATSVSVAGEAVSSGNNSRDSADYDRVSPQFFAAAGQAVVRGRPFTDADTPGSQQVAVVNEAFVRRFFPKGDAVGRSINVDRNASADNLRIVGVVADAKYVDPATRPGPMYFRPLLQQSPDLTASSAIQAARSVYVNAILLDFKTRPYNVDAMVRRTLGQINPNLTVLQLQTLAYQVSGNFTQNKLLSRLAMLFGGLALLLAAIGLYGITAYQVSRRTSEIGLRMALGATRGDVLLMVLRGAFKQVGLGLAIGVPVAVALGYSIAGQLYGVKAWDPVSLLLAVAALSVAAAVAGLVPARRAASIEPVTALRIE
jgi:predicted permease